MLGDVIELSIVVKDLEAAIKRFESLFDLRVYARRESKEFGFKNAILPLGKGHIELMQPTDPSSAVARFLVTHGEGVYLVGFETNDVDDSTKKLRERGARVTLRPGTVAWVHPGDCHGVFVELRRPEQYTSRFD
jgi:methylmalonyl-CoA/ethylmalonyl-CoA epimerase